MNEKKQHSILIVDDTPANLKLLSELLSNSGFRIRVANSAETGFQSIKSSPPDLILLDVKMPGMDGYTLCKELKKDSFTKAIPVIFISASDGTLNTVQAFEAGGVDYIRKPFNTVEVLARIKNHLQLSLLQKQTQNSLATSQNILEAMMDYSPAAIYIKGLDGRYILVNKEFERAFKIAKGESVGKSDHDLFPKHTADVCHNDDKSVLEYGHPREFEEIVEIDNKPRTFLSLKFPLQDADGETYAVGAISTDITSRKQAESELAHLATYDTLTELPNRSLLMALLTRSLAAIERENSKHAVLFIDLDNFKNVNDSLGHHTGDLLLKSVSQRLLECIRKKDTVARMGGDEFVLLLQDIQAPSEAAEVSNKIIRALEAPFTIENRTVFITPSIGIVISPDNGSDPEVLLQNADTAMYHAKSKGRNTFQFFTEEMNQRVLQRMEIEKELRIALEAEQIIPFYQPKIDTDTGKIIGVEALARWHHPEQGNISPNIFIPVAEESNLIFSVDRLILKTTIEQFGPLINEGLFDGTVSINLGAHHFSRDYLLGYIDELLRSYQFPAKNLDLELTESSVMKNASEAIKLMYSLQERGIQISIDDFGTGYSSLSYLKQFPASSLKIDLSFIRDINNSIKDMRLVESIINLAHSLELNCVAEGVETIEQAEILHAMNCDNLQGFLFEPAIEFEKIRELLKADKSFTVLPSKSR